MDHEGNRDRVIQELVEELVGPSPRGEELDCDAPIVFHDAKSSYAPRIQRGSGEEILQRDSPTRRYGVGVLYPANVAMEADATVQEDPIPEDSNGAEPPQQGYSANSDDPVTNDWVHGIEKIGKRNGGSGDESVLDDFDLSTANAFRPSSMGVSFLAELPDGATLVVEGFGGRYRSRRIRVTGDERTWWLRSPVSMKSRFSSDSFRSAGQGTVAADSREAENADGLDLRIEVFSRPRGNDRYLITACVVNRKESATPADGLCLFQSSLCASIVGGEDRRACILPYPGPPAEQLDAEEQSLALLYRATQTFAVGHGCAANWETNPKGTLAYTVSAECLPRFETPSTTPDIRRDDGTPLEVPMAPLAGLVPGDDGFTSLTEVVDLYARWIEGGRARISSLEPRYREAAERHLNECAHSASRMRQGMDYLRGNPTALRAFRLANHAILLQQIHSRRETRRLIYNGKTQRIEFSQGYTEPDPLAAGQQRGRWRAFQIAFLLTTISSVADGNSPERERVELIWFPTGGGKTEAYLGLAAFSIFMRRLGDHADVGVQVLMRYTLRLLTAQQFQRASGLLCAMEHLRRKNQPELGETEFSIGIWVGGATTPNRRTDALSSLREMKRGDTDRNPFIVTRCPWCGAQLGFVEYSGRPPRGAVRVRGYEQRDDTVVLGCPDGACEFASGLPIYVIDQDIYEKRPSLVIGTVDKFAMLAWRPQARTMFGLGPDGAQLVTPPGLIIQDELHLISGPLGSMVGLYESVIEELCTDRRGQHPVRPKLVSSTATIRRYAEQIGAIYARDNVSLFPAPGLDAGDSFFARYARREDGRLARGRIYLGVHAPGLGSLQTAQVRSLTALLQAPVPMSAEERDPWWTLLLFFNSLRELGGALSLFQSDIPDYLKVVRNRLGLEPRQMRRLREVLELTSRLQSDEVPGAIEALEVGSTGGSGRPVDVCLASNIIEVGIDIDRLSVMAVVGQPKTTSQYIQVTGRVGRRWWERPGLVVTLYSASKPRDRSHFEKFRSYHERLYAQVEPTSVTPFSPPALDRALHAVMAVYARQAGDQDVADSPYPYPEDLMERLQNVLLERVGRVDPEERDNLKRVFRKRIQEWERWQREEWETGPANSDPGLLRPAGAYASRQSAGLSWSTPMSMRAVDAECQTEITLLYVNEGDGEVG